MTRNPKDIAVSLYHFQNYVTFLESPSKFEDFLEEFIDGDGKNCFPSSTSMHTLYNIYNQVSAHLDIQFSCVNQFLVPTFHIVNASVPGLRRASLIAIQCQG